MAAPGLHAARHARPRVAKSVWLSLACLGCALVLAYLSYDAYAYRAALAGGSRADATIVEYHDCSPCGRWDSNYYVIDLPAQGRVYRTSLQDWSRQGPRAPGSAVQVRYAQKDPAYYVRDAALPLGDGGLREGLGAAALLLAAIEVRRAPRSSAWRRVGAAIDRFAGVT